MAQLHPDAYQFNTRPHSSSFDLMDAQALELQRLHNVSRALPAGSVVGGVLRFPVGDGDAQYLVVNDNPLTVQHLAFFDAYTIDQAYIRGLNREDVERYLSLRR